MHEIHKKLQKKFLLNIILLVVLNLLIKPFWFFGIEVTVQNRLSNAEYGIYFSLLSFSMIFNFLLDLGITNFNNREIAKHNHLISKYLSNIIGIKVVLGIFYTFLCFSVGLLVGYNTREFMLLAFLVLNQFLSSFILYLRSNINGLLMFISDSILSVLDKFLMIVILSLLLWTNIAGGSFKIEWFIYSQTVAYLLTAIVSFYMAVRNSKYFRPSINIKYFLVILKKSLPFSILVLLMAAYNRFEPILLERLLPDGETQAGIYAQGFRILEVFSNFAYLFPVLLLPLFSKLLKHKDELNNLISLASSLLLIPSIIFSVACSLYGLEIMNFMYHKPGNGYIFSTLILGFTGISVTYLFGTLLTANGNLKQLNIMALSAVCINICMNLLLIPLYEAQGAAIASFITQSGTAIVQFILARKIIGITFTNPLWRIIAWCLTFTLTLLLCHLLVHSWMLGFSLIITIGFVSAILLKIFNARKLYSIIFSKEG